METEGFTYRCTECKFRIDLNCASKNPSIRDKSHPHPLTYFNKLSKSIRCIRCCPVSYAYAGFLRCVQCDFSVHLLCSPLPKVIKFKGHLHSLALEDYHIEDDFGEYYCDHCEGPRDPKECAYHCAEGCPYVVEFNCVIDEVVRSLTDGKVGVRKVNRNTVHEYYFRMVTKGLYLNEVYKSSPDEELELKSLKTSTQMELETIMDENYFHFSFLLFEADAIEQARKKWWDSPLLTVDLKSQVFKIKNYIITKDLQTLLSEIDRKYSDIGHKCCLSEGSKTIVLIQFVQVIQEMIQTRISKVSDKIFLSWLFRLLVVRQAGFRTDFVFEHMIKIGEARSDIFDTLRSFPELTDYYKEIDILNEGIEVRKAKLVTLKTKEKESIELFCRGSSKESRLRCLDKLELCFGTAGKGLL